MKYKKTVVRIQPPSPARPPKHIFSGGRELARPPKHIFNGGRELARPPKHIFNGGRELARCRRAGYGRPRKPE